MDQFIQSDGEIFIEAEARLRKEDPKIQRVFDESIDEYVALVINAMQEEKMNCYGRRIMWREFSNPYNRDDLSE